MNDLQGINLINNYGEYIGILDYYTLNEEKNEYIVYYMKDDKSYHDGATNKESFDRYLKVAKIKSDRYKIIKDKAITHLYHFSPIENTASILEHGILSRYYADLLNVPVTITDPNRYDNELNKISTSISFPNYKMRYKLSKDGYNLIIYDISPRILLTKLDTQFYPTNAANSQFRYIDKNIFTTNKAFEDMFTLDNREPNLHRCYTTDPQAELLINTNIAKDYINSITSEKENDKIKELCYKNNINFHVGNTLFGPRCDYRRWQNGN